MSKTAKVSITNNLGGEAFIQMSHVNSGKKPDVGSWLLGAGAVSPAMTINYETGSGGLDYWYCSASVINKGIYATTAGGASLLNPKQVCMLADSDAGKTFTNTVDTTGFHIGVPSKNCTFSLKRLADYARITNVFVLMLENHSFDHLFGFSKFNNVNGLTGNESNKFNDQTYKTTHPAVDPMPVGPGHEFLNTLTQLCGAGTVNPFPAGPYPAINNSGFVADYSSELAPASDLGDVMACCDSSTQVPNLYTLAKNFALCDNWFSSMPGPTWPNRLFAMGASSAGLDASPSTDQILEWETVDGFTYPHGSIFDLLRNHKPALQYRLYMDTTNEFCKGPIHASGSFPIVMALKNINLFDIHSFGDFQQELQGNYPYQFTWIEPNYGDASGNFTGGASQHPTDSLSAGEKMIAATYDAIRTSPYWFSSVLIITYDEHGGYYDHVAPPAATPPGDKPKNNLNTNGFDFSRYGVRVPAVVVSPLVALPGIIDKDVYDHTSILKTVEYYWQLSPLTERDAAAKNLSKLLSASPPRGTTPIVISSDKISKSSVSESLMVEQEKAEMTVEQRAGEPEPTIAHESIPDTYPLPERGNIIGFLHIALKTEIELSDGSDAEKQAIIDSFKATVNTYGDAREYFKKVASKIAAARAASQPGADE